jgi:hypothetical protein
MNARQTNTFGDLQNSLPTFKNWLTYESRDKVISITAYNPLGHCRYLWTIGRNGALGNRGDGIIIPNVPGVDALEEKFWNSVKEFLPPTGKEVLVQVGNRITKAILDMNGYTWYELHGDEISPSYWKDVE